MLFKYLSLLLLRSRFALLFLTFIQAPHPPLFFVTLYHIQQLIRIPDTALEFPKTDLPAVRCFADTFVPVSSICGRSARRASANSSWPRLTACSFSSSNFSFSRLIALVNLTSCVSGPAMRAWDLKISPRPLSFGRRPSWKRLAQGIFCKLQFRDFPRQLCDLGSQFFTPADVEHG